RRGGAEERSRRPLRLVARYRRYLPPHGRRPGHRRLRAGRLLDPGFHAARPGLGARDWRRRFPSVSVLPAANRFCGHAALPRDPGLELVTNHYRFELWRRPRRLAAGMAADLGTP